MVWIRFKISLLTVSDFGMRIRIQKFTMTRDQFSGGKIILKYFFLYLIQTINVKAANGDPKLCCRIYFGIENFIYPLPPFRSNLVNNYSTCSYSICQFVSPLGYWLNFHFHFIFHNQRHPTEKSILLTYICLLCGP